MTKEDVCKIILHIDRHITNEEVSILYDLAYNKTNWLEIGSFCGASAIVAGLAMKTNSHLTCIDPWPYNYLPYMPKDWVYNTFKHNMNILYKFKGTFIHKLRMTSDRAIKNINTSYDGIYIDGDHSYQAVCNDINNYLLALKPGGILCGHDYDIPEVKKAVQTCLGDDIIIKDRIWIYTPHSVGT